MPKRYGGGPGSSPWAPDHTGSTVRRRAGNGSGDELLATFVATGPENGPEAFIEKLLISARNREFSELGYLDSNQEQKNRNPANDSLTFQRLDASG